MMITSTRLPAMAVRPELVSVESATASETTAAIAHEHEEVRIENEQQALSPRRRSGR